MLALDAYRPEQWHDFFVMVGGSAAVLTGLVFVALSLNVNVVIKDATHRYRARHAVGHDRRVRDLRSRAHGRPGPPRCGHRMARGRSHLDCHIPTRVRPGRPSRWK